VFARCHEVTHYLSRYEYETTKSVPATYAQCDSTCHGGCYHGTLEAFLKEKQVSITDAKITQAVTTVCGSESDYPNRLVYFECLHGLGHAGMFISDMDVALALKLCDNLAVLEGRERCYSGVFMENSSSSTSTDHPGKYVKADDPLYPCNSLEEKYQQVCYRYQSSYFAIIKNQDWVAVGQLCLQIPARYQPDCFYTVGTNQVGFTQDFSKMQTECEAMPDKFKKDCFTGVVGSLAFRFVGDISKMAEFCTRLKPPYQENCLQSIGASITDWSNDEKIREDYCRSLKQNELTTWCTQGLSLGANASSKRQSFQ
jgi:hypothetical protein